MTLQYQRIERLILKQYGVNPEYLWRVFPQYAIFRHHDNRKWFGLLMNIAPEKLLKVSLSYQSKFDKEIIDKKEIYVLDVKLAPADIPAIYNTDGIYPGYPRSAGNWVSIILEDIIPDESIMELVKESYNITTIK